MKAVRCDQRNQEMTPEEQAEVVRFCMSLRLNTRPAVVWMTKPLNPLGACLASHSTSRGKKACAPRTSFLTGKQSQWLHQKHAPQRIQRFCHPHSGPGVEPQAHADNGRLPLFLRSHFLDFVDHIDAFILHPIHFRASLQAGFHSPKPVKNLFTKIMCVFVIMRHHKSSPVCICPKWTFWGLSCRSKPVAIFHCTT